MDNNQMRLMRLGAIQDKKTKIDLLTTQIENLVKDVNLALFMEDGIDPDRIDEAVVLIDDMKKKAAEFRELKKEIKRLENV